VLRLITAYEMELNTIRAVVNSGFHFQAIVFQECLYILLVRDIRYDNASICKRDEIVYV
jgi:hypothetical protein